MAAPEYGSAEVSMRSCRTVSQDGSGLSRRSGPQRDNALLPLQAGVVRQLVEVTRAQMTGELGNISSATMLRRSREMTRLGRRHGTSAPAAHDHGRLAATTEREGGAARACGFLWPRARHAGGQRRLAADRQGARQPV